jgi:hypothetical protein
MTPAERQQKTRSRRRLGLRPAQVLVSEQEIDYLLARTTKRLSLRPVVVLRQAVRAANLLVDLIYFALDPRTRG